MKNLLLLSCAVLFAFSACSSDSGSGEGGGGGQKATVTASNIQEVQGVNKVVAHVEKGNFTDIANLSRHLGESMATATFADGGFTMELSKAPQISGLANTSSAFSDDLQVTDRAVKYGKVIFAVYDNETLVGALVNTTTYDLDGGSTPSASSASVFYQYWEKNCVVAGYHNLTQYNLNNKKGWNLYVKQSNEEGETWNVTNVAPEDEIGWRLFLLPYNVAVSNIQVTPGVGSLTVSWNAPSDVSKLGYYTVQYKGSRGGGHSYGQNTEGTETTLTLTDLEDDVYEIGVVAVSKYGSRANAVTATGTYTPLTEAE